MLEEKGILSVAAPGFKAPSVVVSFTSNPQLQNTKLVAAQGLQIAAGMIFLSFVNAFNNKYFL